MTHCNYSPWLTDDLSHRQCLFHGFLIYFCLKVVVSSYGFYVPKCREANFLLRGCIETPPFEFVKSHPYLNTVKRCFWWYATHLKTPTQYTWSQWLPNDLESNKWVGVRKNIHFCYCLRICEHRETIISFKLIAW